MIPKHTIVLRKDILWLQWIGCTGSLLLLFVSGLMGGWTSPYLAQLTAKDSPLPITSEEASWVASLLNLGRLLGAVPGAISVYYFGSKCTLLLNSIPLAMNWVSTIMADSVEWLYAARLIGGFSLGMSVSSYPIYLGEISDPGIRGAMVAMAMTGWPIGVLAGNLMGAYVSMSTFAYISLVPTAVCIFLFFCIPESPHHLVRTEKMQEAKDSMARYNPGVDVDVEVKSLGDFVNSSQSVTLLDKLKEFNIPQNRKAGIIIIMLYLFPQLSGVNSVLFYLEIILIDGGLVVIRPSTMVVLGALSAIISSLVAVHVADKFGRKTLLIFSSAGVAVSLAALGVHFTLLENGFDPAGLQWLLMSSVLAYEAFMFVGLCPVPGMILSELFAPNIKSIAACICSFSMGIFAFISTKTYQAMLDAMGLAWIFWLCAGFMVFVMIFALTMLPETRGKSLQEIQKFLHNK